MSESIKSGFKITIAPNIKKKGIAFFILDLDSNKYMMVPGELTEEISNKKGTLLFIHKELNIYGVVRDGTSSKPYLVWMKQSDYNEVKDYILNNSEKEGTYIDISDEDDSIFKAHYRREWFCRTRPVNSKFLQMSIPKLLGLEEETSEIDIDAINTTQSDEQDNIEEELEEVDKELYAAILKLMKRNDTFSFPRKFYDDLYVIVKRVIKMNRDCTSMESISLIRFNKEDKDSAIARIENDSEQRFIRITIIKEMNNDEFSEQRISDYEVSYNEWKKKHSYYTN